MHYLKYATDEGERTTEYRDVTLVGLIVQSIIDQ